MDTYTKQVHAVSMQLLLKRMTYCKYKRLHTKALYNLLVKLDYSKEVKNDEQL